LPVRGQFCLLSFLALCATIAGAAVPDDGDTLGDTAGGIWNLPVVERMTVPQPEIGAPRYPNCSVEPLPEVVDAEAVRFETEDGPDTGGLLPAMAEAVEKFRKLVANAGGTFDLKSAYRPLAYQEHLQQVWFKWMRELRYNRQPGCQALRAEVSAEFTRHKLMPTQMPVTDSDHTRGMAIDVAVMMPRVVRTKKRRVIGVSLDRLALMAGLKRPDIRRDPVHFKLVVSIPAHIAPSE
jgi:hypothetical protein